MSSIFISNPSSNATEDELREAFSQHGKVLSVNLIKDRDTGRPRGFAFIERPDGWEAATAIKAMNLREIAGRSVAVDEVKPRADRPRPGGRRVLSSRGIRPRRVYPPQRLINTIGTCGCASLAPN
jgi:cold-inducible RNA-binding protein